MPKQVAFQVHLEELGSPLAQTDDSFSELRTSLNASPATSSISGSSTHPRSLDDWDAFPWHRFPNLTISERRGRPKSWIWQHEYDLQEIKDGTRHRWVCYKCVRKKDPRITAHLASATVNIETHLGNQHNIHSGKSVLRQGRKRTIDDMFSSRQMTQR